LATPDRFNELKDKSDLDGNKAFADIGKVATAVGAKAYLAHARKALPEAGDLIDSIALGIACTDSSRPVRSSSTAPTETPITL